MNKTCIPLEEGGEGGFKQTLGLSPIRTAVQMNAYPDVNSGRMRVNR